MNREIIDALKKIILGESSASDVETAFRELIEEQKIENGSESIEVREQYHDLPFFYKFWRKLK